MNVGDGFALLLVLASICLGIPLGVFLTRWVSTVETEATLDSLAGWVDERRAELRELDQLQDNRR